MDADKLNVRIKQVGMIGAFASLIFLFAAADLFISGIREPKDCFRAIAGSSIPVSGKIDYLAGRKIQTLNDIVYIPGGNGLVLEFKGLQGNIWRGILTVNLHVPEAEYTFMVISSGAQPAPDTRRYRVQVFHDEGAYRRSFKSLIYRHTGQSPFRVMLAALPFIAISFGMVFLLSGKKDDFLASQGSAEIFKTTREKGELEIYFGLGHKHHLKRGDTVYIYDPTETLVGEAEVREIYNDYTSARVSGTGDIQPGCHVRLS